MAMNQTHFYELEPIAGYQAPSQGAERRPQEWLLCDKTKHQPRIVGRYTVKEEAERALAQLIARADART